MRAVLTRALGTGDGATAVRLAGVLSRFWLIRGHLGEGRRWFEAALSAAPRAEGRGRALRALAILGMEQGELDRAAEAAEEALTLDRQSGDEEGTLQAMGLLVDIVAVRGASRNGEGAPRGRCRTRAPA